MFVSHSDDVIEKQIEDGLLRPELRDRVSYVLLRKHRHQTKKPMHRSLVDIGKSVSSTTSESACLLLGTRHTGQLPAVTGMIWLHDAGEVLGLPQVPLQSGL